MRDSFRITQYSVADQANVFCFLRTVCSAESSARLIQQWDWKYENNPFCPAASPYILLAQENDRIIGMMGGMSLRVSIAGKDYPIVNTGDWFVHPAYRGRGLIRQIYRQYMAEQPLGFGWSNEKSNRITHRTARVQGMQSVPLVKPLNAIATRLFEWVAGARTAGVQISTIGKFDARFDELWQRARQNYPVILVRDQDYLNWRFTQRPDARYTILIATRGEKLLGYFVLRLVEQKGKRLAFGVDWLTPDHPAEILHHLMRHAIQHAHHAGASYISIRATSPSHRQLFYRWGFIPWLLNPPTYFIVRTESPEFTLGIFSRPQQWFLTLGDGDLEMSF